MSGHPWQPSAPLENLRHRARILRQIREHFARNGVLEVETPQLCAATVTEPHLASLHVPGHGFLQTSPEYAMKRLLAAGSGPIYQMARAFRGEETGRLHNREFTLLEWYRPGWSIDELIEEVATIARLALGGLPAQRHRYRDLFRIHLGLDPLTCPTADLRAAACASRDLGFAEADRDTWLELLMSEVIEPRLGAGVLNFVVDYPPSQAALARLGVDAEGDRVAGRFELYANGVELANGYDELLDAGEQRARFAADLLQRSRLGLPEVAFDECFLAALDSGIPPCSGVALGVDRLVMLAAGATTLAGVIAFPASRA